MAWSIVVTVGLLAGAPAAGPQPPGPPWAHKLFLPGIGENPDQSPPPVLVHNFGTVPFGTLCVHTFKLTNIYDYPLQVSDHSRETGLEVYPPQRLLQPGDSADCTFTLDTRKLAAGRSVHSMTLKVVAGRTWEEHHSPVYFRFEVDARADVMITPGELNLGTVVTGAKKSAIVELSYQGRLPGWRITAAKPDGPFDVKLEDAGRGKYKLTAELRPNTPAGRLAGSVSLTTTDPALSVVQVPVTGNVLAPLTVAPAGGVVLFAKPVKVGEKDEQAILIQSINRPFQVRPVADPGDGVSVEPFGFPGPTQRVTVRFAPTRPGPVRKELRLETDLPGKPAVTIRVEAIGE